MSADIPSFNSFETLGEVLRYRASQNPEKLAFAVGTGDRRRSVTYASLDERARAIAARLAGMDADLDRALLIYPTGPEFIAAVFGCLYAGITAVPAPMPRARGPYDSSLRIIENAGARFLLASSDVADRVDRVKEAWKGSHEINVVLTDELRIDDASGWQPRDPAREGLALLQYTSGSTQAPRGVMLSHRNILANLEGMRTALKVTERDRGVFWLPHHHDMGLMGGLLQPIFGGGSAFLMSPTDFLRKPIDWLRAISEQRATMSAAPTFAYDLCVRTIGEQDRSDLDLSSWRVACCGAEPVRAETLDRFREAFGPCGFQPETFYPCYGMAETTLLATGGSPDTPPLAKSFSTPALQAGRAEAADGEGSRPLVSCGAALPGHQIKIVNPESCTPCAPNEIGEIWLSGPSVSSGYWNAPDATQESFEGRLDGDEGSYLRTGDLGVLKDGELYVTGRLKDLLIIRGQNHHPHDLETTAAGAHVALHPLWGCAFSVDVDGEERLVVAHEIQRSHRKTSTEEIVSAVRAAVFKEHGLPVHAVALLRPGKLPKTTSGKVQRKACQQRYLDGSLDCMSMWTVSAPTAPAIDSESGAEYGQTHGDRSTESIRATILECISRRVGVVATDLDSTMNWAQFGLDSATIVSVAVELEERLGLRLEPALLFDYPTIDSLARHIAGEADQRWGAEMRDRAPAEPIAVVGIGCRFPGAPDPDAFWELLREGVDAVGEIPGDRWNIEEFFDTDPEASGKMYVRRAGLVQNVDEFDPLFFEIAPVEAAGMDPQQRLLLEVAWEALEHGGQATSNGDADAGVFVGISHSDYARLADAHGGDDAIDAYVGTGTSSSIAAGRLSYALGLHGPCMAVDTACSSSLVAVHLAIQSLRNGECRMALAGGVNLILDPGASIALCKLNALSPDGQCRTFDASANGYVRGEGAGMVVLKRLSDAYSDGDNVLAVLRNSAINHDGRSNGLTAPNGRAQEAVVRRALSGAGIDPSRVGYVEAHGTGTPLGDPIEVRALSRVLCRERNGGGPLAIGSVKTNIGHLEAAAGIAGLIKVILSLNHGEIPPHLNCSDPNPQIPWESLPVTIPAERFAWPVEDGPRVAGVSAFGFSGTNAHVVVEEAPAKSGSRAALDRPFELLTLSGKTEDALNAMAARYREKLSGADQPPFHDVAHTANVGRAHFAHRLAILAKDAEEAREALDSVAAGRPGPMVARGEAHHAGRPRLAFLFTGQGSQYAGMGRELYETQPTFRQTLDDCDRLLSPHLEHSLLSVLFGEQDTAPLLDQTAYTQPALFALQYALGRLWMSWGIQPAAVMGHSVGEYAAACVAGVFSLEDGLKLMAARGRLAQELPDDGMMIVAMADEQTIADRIASYAHAVSIAAVNGPEQIVLAGARDTVEEIVAALERDGIKTRPLAVSHAFHSPLVEPMLADLQQACEGIPFSEPKIRTVSNLSGDWVGADGVTPEYWRRHLRLPVRFADGMKSLQNEGINAFLEIGPKPTLLGMGRANIANADSLWLPSLREGRGDWQQMLESLGALYVHGADVDWREFDRGYSRRIVSLPTYPFQRQRHWFEDGSGRAVKTAASAADDHGDPIRDWLFEIEWQPRSRLDFDTVRPDAAYLPAPRDLAARVNPESEWVASQQKLDRYRDLAVEMDALSSAYVRAALDALGFEFAVNDAFTTAQLADRLKVRPDRNRLLNRLLEMLAEDGIVTNDKSTWRLRNTGRADSADGHWATLSDRFPECRAELELLRQCGPAMADVLAGRTDPLHVLFPDGSTELVERLYQDSPFARALNTLVAQTVARAVEALPPRLTLRILEVGAGTGGTTSEVLPCLPRDRTEYVFTDVGELFLHAAKRKFHEYPFVRFGTLDIEQDPREQGYAPHQFDLVIAANVLHATRDLRQTLDHVKRLLAPQGVLIMLEGVQPQRWLDLTFGLTDGWWRFADTDLRPSYPLLSRSNWLDVMRDSGFVETEAFPDSGDKDSTQIVVVARAPQFEYEPSTRPSQDIESGKSGAWFICADGQGVGECLVAQLEARGEPCIVLRAGDRYEQMREREFVLDPADGDAWMRVLQDVWPNGHTSCRGIVHLWSLDANDFEASSLEHVRNALRLGCESVAELLHHSADVQWSAAPRIWLVTCGAQPAGTNGSPVAVGASTLWGLGRVMAEELSARWGGLVDLDPAVSPDASADLLLEELSRPDDENQIAFSDGQRYAARLVRRPERQNAPSEPLKWRRDASYLITGGLGDIGLAVADWMVGQGADQCILLGRTGLPPRDSWDEELGQDSPIAARIRAVRKLEERGARVHVAALDVADERGVEALLRSLIEEGWPPVRGVVHSAGVLLGKPLPELTATDVRDVCRSKVEGACALHRLFKDAPLDFFVMFSSGASILGPAFVGAYAAANAFLDTFAHYRRAHGLPALTVNWGIWSDVGMVARSQRNIAPEGAGFITPQHGLEVLHHLMNCGATQTMVMPVNWREWSYAHSVVGKSPLLSNLVPKDAAALADVPDGEDGGTARDALLAMHPDERRPVLQKQLTDLVSGVLRVSAEELDLDEPLSHFGLDSLMAIELKNQIEKTLGAALTMASFLSEPSIEQLCIRLDEQLTAPTEDFGVKLTSGSDPGKDQPLSYNQQSLWFLRQLIPAAVSFNMPGAVRIHGKVNLNHLKRALENVMARHASLRTTFLVVDGQPVQRVHKRLPLPLEVVDDSNWTESERTEYVIQKAHERFDLEHSAPFRVVLMYSKAQGQNGSDAAIAPNGAVLIMSMDHIVSDFWSVAVLVRDIMAFYQEASAGVPAMLEPLTMLYIDYVHWQRELLASPAGDRLLAYWKTQLGSELPALDVPMDRPRSSSQTFQGDSLSLTLDQNVSTGIKALASARKTTLFTILVAAFQVFLHRLSGQNEFIVGSVTAGRTHPDLSGLIGYFVNPLALRADLSENPTFNGYLDRARDIVMGAIEHQAYPPALLADSLSIKRDFSRPPLFENMFILQKAQLPEVSSISPFALGIGNARFEINSVRLSFFVCVVMSCVLWA